jgi:hypothetical protein
VEGPGARAGNCPSAAVSPRRQVRAPIAARTHSPARQDFATGGRACSPRILGIGAVAGHQEHRNPSTSVATDARGGGRPCADQSPGSYRNRDRTRRAMAFLRSVLLESSVTTACPGWRRRLRRGSLPRSEEPGDQPRDRRLHDRPTLAPRVTRSSSSWANVSGIPPSIPAMAPSRASFEG